MKPITVKIELSKEQVIGYIREGLLQQGLTPPADDADFLFPFDVNLDEVLVEVVKVSVSQKIESQRGSASLRSDSIEQAPRESRPRRVSVPEDTEDVEDVEDVEEKVSRFNAAMPSRPVKGASAAASPGRVRVGLSLEDLGKDPLDMKDEF